MTLTKTCHASNMMQDSEKQFVGLLQPGKLSEWRCFDVPLLYYEKIESHFETQISDAQRINLTFVLHRFVANFVSYICAKYCLDWFSFHIVIMNVIGVNFFWNTVYVNKKLSYCCDSRPYCMQYFNAIHCDRNISTSE